MNRATHWTNAKPGAAEIEVVVASGRPSGEHAQHIAAVRRYHFAHRAVAAAARVQTGKIVPALVGLFSYRNRNVEHQWLPLRFADFGPCGGERI